MKVFNIFGVEHIQAMQYESGKQKGVRQILTIVNIYHPKYHCELNYIEMVWGWVKSHHRRTCTYNYKDLKDRLPKTFDDLLDVSFVRKVFQHCLRFMSGYRQNLEGPLLDYAMRKYTSHRVVPIGVAEELSKEYAAFLKIITEKNKK